MENKVAKKDYCDKCFYQAQNTSHYNRHCHTKSHLNADIMIEYHGMDWWIQWRKKRTEGRKATRKDDRRLSKDPFHLVEAEYYKAYDIKNLTPIPPQ